MSPRSIFVVSTHLALLLWNVSADEDYHCSQAMRIIPNGDFVYGTIHSVSDGDCFEASCSDFLDNMTSNSGWYVFSGDGSVMRATTCSNVTNFDTTISIHRGDCENLEMLEYNDDDSWCDSYILSSMVEWETELSVDYYVEINGLSGATGDFRLDVRSVDNTSITNSSWNISANDDHHCSQAMRIVPNGDFLYGTIHSVSDADCFEPSCSEFLDNMTSNFGWYVFSGDGGLTRASTCSYVTNFDTTITIYRGDCENLESLAYDDDYWCDSNSLSSTVEWETEQSVDYYIQIDGFFGATGDFRLEVRSVDNTSITDITWNVTAVDDHRCSQAMRIVPNGDFVDGSIYSVSDPELLEVPCFDVLEDTPSSSWWYVFSGDGSLMRASTCTDVTNFDTIVSIYRGDCEHLECLAQNDDGRCDSNSLSSVVEWQTDHSVDNYIRINGYMGILGDFRLDVHSVNTSDLTWNGSAEEDHNCSQAMRIVPNGDFVYGTIHSVSDTQFFDYIEDDHMTSSFRWYVFSGDGSLIRASTCSDVTNFDTMISIYRGDCEYLEYFTQNDDGWCDSNSLSSIVEWQTEQSVDYYIRINGYMGAEGDFRLDVRSVINTSITDFCEEAITLDIDSESSIVVSTNNNLFESFDCGDVHAEVVSGVWYSFIGNGAGLVFSTCSDGYEPPFLYIFSGTCNELECIAGSANITGFCEESTLGGIQAIVATEVNTQYFLLVGRYFVETDLDFELTISEIMIPQNSFCTEAPELLPDSETTVGSLDNTPTMHSNIICGYVALSVERVVWYSLMGTGDIFVITTCSMELDFESSILVTSGTCDVNECVAFSNSEICSLSLYPAARAVFQSEIGTEYHVMVENSDYEYSGNFGLTVTTIKLPPNSNCSNPLEVQPDSGTIDGTILNVTGLLDDNFCPCQTHKAWFTLVGTGDDYEITTCSSKLNFDSAIHILTGTCEDPQTIMEAAYNDFGCSETPYESARVILRTEPGVTYRILVEPVDDLPASQGEFDLMISTVDVQPTHVCSGARILQLNDASILGSLVNNAANFSGMNSGCTPNGNASTAWYSLLGTGGVYAFSTCSVQLNFDSVISVTTGPCNEQQCTIYESSSELDCSYSTHVASRVVVPTEIGVEYWIAVQSMTVTNGLEGEFGLSISSVLPAPDDVMDDDRLDSETGTTTGSSQATNISTSPLLTNDSKVGNGLHLRPGNSSSMIQQYSANNSGFNRRNLLPSLLVTISIMIMSWMVNA